MNNYNEVSALLEKLCSAKGVSGAENEAAKVAAEFLAKVFHPRIRSKSHFDHCRESPAKASILLVHSVLNVG